MATDPLSSTFAALADPTRRAILTRLVSGVASVTELAQPFDMTLPAITKHLKVLERAGLVSRSRVAQWRPCRLQPQPLRDVADWMQQYRVMGEQHVDGLEEGLLDMQAQERACATPSRS
ncbi:MAG: ArsR/SmtB family transcription factor [Rhodanobacter sp.]